MLNLVNKVLAEIGSPPPSEISLSIVWAIDLWYLLLALLHSFDGRLTRTERLEGLKTRWYLLHAALADGVWSTKAASARSRGPAQGEMEADNELQTRRASASGRTTFSRNRRNKKGAPKAKCPHEAPIAVAPAIAEAAIESRTEEEERSSSRCRPEEESDPQVLNEVLSTELYYCCADYCKKLWNYRENDKFRSFSQHARAWR